MARHVILLILLSLAGSALGCTASSETGDSWQGALTDEECAALAAQCEGHDGAACAELDHACSDPAVDEGHRCELLHHACVDEHDDASCEEAAAVCAPDHDGEAEHDGDAEHDGEAQHDGEAEHEGDAEHDCDPEAGCDGDHEEDPVPDDGHH